MKAKTSEMLSFIQFALDYESDECLLWPYGKNSAGYASFGGQFLITRFICEEEHGKPPTQKHQAAHSCGKGHEGCINKRHLSWKTHKENHADRRRHGTNLPGNTKLSKEDVEKILALKGSKTQQQIADDFGIARGHVSNIHRKTRW